MAHFFFVQASRKVRTTVEYQQFCRQLYHACLAYVYMPLKPAMTSPEVVQCPDGHFRRAIFSIGPYIADYPEQVWLTMIVNGWCPS
jgi:Plavaka transposase